MRSDTSREHLIPFSLSPFAILNSYSPIMARLIGRTRSAATTPLGILVLAISVMKKTVALAGIFNTFMNAPVGNFSNGMLMTIAWLLSFWRNVWPYWIARQRRLLPLRNFFKGPRNAEP